MSHRNTIQDEIHCRLSWKGSADAPSKYTCREVTG